LSASATFLLQHFDRLAEAPGGIAKLRALVLQLAIQGKLTGLKSGERENESDDPFAIPAGWRWVKLKDVTKRVHYGFTASSDAARKEVRLLRITDIQDSKVDWDTVPGCEIAKEQIAQYELHPRDILIARTGGTIGKTFLVEHAPVCAVFASYLIRVIPRDDISEYYLKRFLESPLYWTQLYAESKGTGQPNVNGTALSNLDLPLPPLAEQRRIVAKVEELMGLCDALEAAQREREAVRTRLRASARHQLALPDSGSKSAGFVLKNLPCLTTTPEDLDSIRQSVRHLAMQGMLVRQNPKDEAASKLLEKIDAPNKGHRRRADSEFGEIEELLFSLPESWQWVRFGRLVDGADSGWSPQSESFPRSGDNWGVIKVSAVSWDRFLPKENKQLLPGAEFPPNAVIREGDFLISRANTSELVAKAVVVEVAPEKLILSDKSVRLALTPLCEKRYVCMVNNHADYARQFYAEEASGTSYSMKNVSREVIYRLPLPLPPLAEQRRIVAKVDEIMAVLDALEAALTTARATAENLLAATVAGLTAQLSTTCAER
jgi:type I restriction enzyme S subunit